MIRDVLRNRLGLIYRSSHLVKMWDFTWKLPYLNFCVNYNPPSNIPMHGYSLVIMLFYIIYIISDGTFDDFQSTKSIPSKHYFIRVWIKLFGNNESVN